MTRSQANLQFGIVKGLKGLSVEAKWLYVVLLVEPSINQCGVGVYRLPWWAQAAELDLDAAEKAFAELEAERYAYGDETTGEVLVRTLIRNDGVARKPNVLWAACRAAKIVESPKLRGVIADELRKLPPKPAPTVGRDGRHYQHPDPHAIADEIDPNPTPPGGHPNHSGNGSANPSANGSGNPSESNGSPNHSGNHGGGGGGGEVVTSLRTHFGGSRTHAHAPAREDAPLPPASPFAVTTRCPRCARLGLAPDDPGPNCRACAAIRHADEQRSQTADTHSTAEAGAAARARAEQCRARGRCDGMWLLEHPGGPPVEPAVKCAHPPTLQVVNA